MRLINQFSPPRRPKHRRLSNIIDELRLCDNLQLALGAVTPLTLIANNRRARSTPVCPPEAILSRIIRTRVALDGAPPARANPTRSSLGSARMVGWSANIGASQFVLGVNYKFNCYTLPTFLK